jgi:SAM-dependent methyltransferase
MIQKIRRLYGSGTLGLAIKGEIGSWISTLGSRLGSERFVYNPWTFAGFHRAALEASPTMVEGILGLFPRVRTAADFGCGTGAYVAEFRKHGVTAVGFEYSPRAREMAREAFGLDIEPFDLTVFGAAKAVFDVAVSFEVAEHMRPELGDRLVSVCCAHAPLVVFTAAHPGQPGQGHINLQPKSYWIDQFARHGFAFDEVATKRLEGYLRANLIRGFWLADNLGVYQKQGKTGRP